MVPYIGKKLCENKSLVITGPCSSSFIIHHHGCTILHSTLTAAMDPRTKQRLYLMVGKKIMQHIIKMKFREILSVIDQQEFTPSGHIFREIKINDNISLQPNGRNYGSFDNNSGYRRCVHNRQK